MTDVNETNTEAPVKRKLSYTERKVAHWSRMGTPSQIDPQTGAASPNWVIEAREEKAKRTQR